MIRKALLLKVFDAAYMQRWNDKADELYLLYPDNENFSKSLECFSFYKDKKKDKEENMKL